jgi:hypothetical protein
MRLRGVTIAVISTAVLLTAVAGADALRLVGTKAGNLIVGSNGPDRLIGKGGGDLIKGRGGGDRLSGGKGRDLLNGGPGADRLVAGPSRDGIKAADGRRDRLINGGPGANVCVIDIPADLPVTRNCGRIQAGQAPGGGGQGGSGGGGGGGGGVVDPNLLAVNSADGLLCLPLAGCAFTITGSGADAPVGTVSGGGAVTSVTGSAVNLDMLLGTWLATGTFNCSSGGTGWLQVTMGTKSTPQIPVQC